MSEPGRRSGTAPEEALPERHGPLALALAALRGRDAAQHLNATASSWSRMQVSVPDADRRAVAVMRGDPEFLFTRLKDSPTAADAFARQAREYASAMRGTWVPADVYDLAVQHRDACRAREGSPTPGTCLAGCHVPPRAL